MSDDLITSLRALAAARHDDLSIAVDAVIEIERLRAANKQLVAGIDTITRRKREEIEGLRAEIERLRAALEYMVNVCPAIDPDGGCAHERARNALEGKP